MLVLALRLHRERVRVLVLMVWVQQQQPVMERLPSPPWVFPLQQLLARLLLLWAQVWGLGRQQLQRCWWQG
jgi:hypothetical protein